MKKILFLIILLSFLHSYADAQIALTGNITTIGVSSYPTHIDSLGKGGYMTMPTIAARDGIPTLRRKHGMLVYVQATDVLYKLGNVNLDNSNWVEVSLLSATTNIQTFLASPTSANLSAAVTNDVGTGSLVFSNTPTLSNTTLSGTLTLTAPLTVANGGTGTNSSTGTGSVVLSTSPALTGTPTAITADASSNSTQIATTAFVKSSITNSSAPDATATAKGILKLANDLGGSADSPTVNSVGGVISSTINTVASSVLSATSDNTANTIVKRDNSGGFSTGTITGTLSGTASNANVLTTGRTIGITGDITYTSASFDGTGNVTGVGTLTNTGVTANTYGSSTLTSTSVPVITVDSKGRITSATSTNIPSATSSVTGLLTSTDYQAFSDKQGALTAGSGISISGGTISATGITSGNLSPTAGITNEQLANSSITIGTTAMSLGGTYTSVTGLSSVTTGNLTATSVVTNTLKVTGGSYTATNAVLTTDGTGNAIWSSSGLYTLNGITAAAQTFSTTTDATSTTPSFTSSGTVHTLNIPLASEEGTTAGLISKADHILFRAKLTDVTKGNGISIEGQGGEIGNPNRIAIISVSDAEATVKGIIQLAGDLTGTAELPTVNTVGGVASTTIATAITSATPTNTVNTIVKRDEIGGFAAGAITATSVLASGNISSTSLNTGTLTATSITTGTLRVTGGTPTLNAVLTSDGNGNATWASNSNGLYTLNGISAASQIFSTTSSGTDFTITGAIGTGSLSTTAIHAFNLPDASLTNRGVITTGTQTIAGQKSFANAVTNSVATDAGSSTNIDFSLSNLAYTSASPGPGSPGTNFTLTNMKNGGTYTLAVQGTTSGTASFTASGLTGVNVGNYESVSGKQTVYTFVVMGSTFYYSMVTEL